MLPGDEVRFRGRRFVLVSVKEGWAVIRNDEGEDMRVRAVNLTPA